MPHRDLLYLLAIRTFWEMLYNFALSLRDTSHDLPAERRAKQISAFVLSIIVSKVVTIIIEGGAFLQPDFLYATANLIAFVMKAAKDPSYQGKPPRA